MRYRYGVQRLNSHYSELCRTPEVRHAPFVAVRVIVIGLIYSIPGIFLGDNRRLSEAGSTLDQEPPRVDRFPQIRRTTLSKIALPSPGTDANPEKPYSGSSREYWHIYTLYRAALHRVPRRLFIMQLQMSGLASSPAQSKVKCLSVSLRLANPGFILSRCSRFPIRQQC
jgi:hypothetical protein